MIHEQAGRPLDPVGARLVEGVPGAHIPVDLLVAHGPKGHVRPGGAHVPVVRGQNADAGVHDMAAALQKVQILLCPLRRVGLAQHPTVQIHHRIRADDAVVGMKTEHRLGLLLRQSFHQLLGGSAHGRYLLHVAFDDLEGDVHQGQYLPPPGGLGGKDDLHRASRSKATGQWSLPYTSLKMRLSCTFSMSRSLTKK